uniref:Uncharacterized protein n=1 Tax=Hyaloperonospora arabidopsidis (strain Emoy2) TaxID=559515 RepID=M4BZ79_HYAAE
MSTSSRPVSAHLRCVSGFFRMDMSDEAVDEMGEPPLRMGLLDGKSWADVYAYMDKFRVRNPSRRIKLVILLRHGEATHNATKARVARGQGQAEAAASMLEGQIEDCGLQLQRVFVSPLDRTLQTYDRVCHRRRDIPVSVMELARETLGVVNCDRRKVITSKREAYPQLDFVHVASDDDTWWQPDHRETSSEIAARAATFLDKVLDKVDERCVLVVSHSGFCRGCFAAVGHRYYRPRNAEFIPMLITDAREDELQ